MKKCQHCRNNEIFSKTTAKCLLLCWISATVNYQSISQLIGWHYGVTAPHEGAVHVYASEGSSTSPHTLGSTRAAAVTHRQPDVTGVMSIRSSWWSWSSPPQAPTSSISSSLLPHIPPGLFLHPGQPASTRVAWRHTVYPRGRVRAGHTSAAVHLWHMCGHCFRQGGFRSVS